MDRPYHHGTLRRSLVDAAIAELEEHGRDRFSLRRTAARAGVSHAAPAHHFGNAQGLLSAVRAEGFARLAAAMRTRRDRETDPFERLVATGVGYVDHAVREPALFDLMFGNKTTDGPPEGSEGEAFDILLESMAEAWKIGPDEEPDGDYWIAVGAAWSLVHGYAQLVTIGLTTFLDRVGSDREATLREMLRRSLPRR